MDDAVTPTPHYYQPTMETLCTDFNTVGDLIRAETRTDSYSVGSCLIRAEQQNTVSLM